MRPRYYSWTAAVCRADGTIEGTATLVGPRLLLTCAHVVPEESGSTVRFPFSADPDHEFAVDVERAPHEDLALLRITEGPGVEPAPLKAPHPDALGPGAAGWFSFGFPHRDLIGNYTRGAFGGGLGLGRVRLDTDRDERFKLAPGFSGAGVWGFEEDAVIGLVAQGMDGDGRAITLYRACQAFPDSELVQLTSWSVRDGDTSSLHDWGLRRVAPDADPAGPDDGQLGEGRTPWDLMSDPELGRHWGPRARGVRIEAEPGYYFQGRRRALERVVAWLKDRDEKSLLVVTGSPGVGKSAVLGRIVTTADFVLREALPEDDTAVRAPVGSIGCAIHARGKTPEDVALEIARGASAPLPLDAAGQVAVEDLRLVLDHELQRSDRPFTILVDALDESTDVRRLARTLLVPLAASDGIRVVVGTRRADDGGDLLEELGTTRSVLDLDAPDHFSTEDLTAYVRSRLLAEAGDGAAGTTATNDVADRIAMLSEQNFLIASIATSLYQAREETARGLTQISFRPGVRGVLRDYLALLRPVAGLSAETVLAPLAYADGSGFPLELWSVAVHAIAGKALPLTTLREFVSADRGSLIEVVEPAAGEAPGYRVSHQALSDALITRRVEDGSSTFADQAALTQAFLEHGRQVGWPASEDYLRQSLSRHAAAGGMTDALLLEDGYLLVASLHRLREDAGTAGSRDASDRLSMIGRSPHAEDLTPVERAAAFSISEMAAGHGGAFTRLARASGASHAAAWANLDVSDELAVLEGNPSAVVSVAADNRHVVAGSWAGPVLVWDLASGREIHRLPGNTQGTRAVAISPDGTRVVTGGDDWQVRAWDLSTGREVGQFAGGYGPVGGLALTPDGARAITVTGDESVRLWDVGTGREEKALTSRSELRARDDWILKGADSRRAAVVTPDGRRAVTLAAPLDIKIPYAVRVWDLATGTHEHDLLGHIGSITALAVTPDSNHAVTGGRDGTLRMWHLDTGREVLRMSLAGERNDIEAVAVTPDGTRAISGGADGSLRVWSLVDGQQQRVLLGHSSPVIAVTVTPNGRHAVSSAHDRSVRVWHLGEHHEQTAQEPIGLVTAVALSPNRAQVITSGFDGNVRVWDATSGDPIGVLAGQSRSLHELVVTQQFIMAGGLDGTVQIWSRSKAIRALGRGKPRLFVNDRRLSKWTANPDGTRLIGVISAGSLVTWSMLSRKVIGSLDIRRRDEKFGLQPEYVRALALTPDEQRIVVLQGSETGVVNVWDLATGRKDLTLAGHERAASSIAVTPDGHHVVTGGFDGTVRVWDLAQGREQAVLPGHDQEVSSVAVTPDGSHVVSAAADRTVRVWGLTSGAVEAVMHVPFFPHAVAASDSRAFIGLSRGALAIDFGLGHSDG